MCIVYIVPLFRTQYAIRNRRDTYMNVFSVKGLHRNQSYELGSTFQPGNISIYVNVMVLQRVKGLTYVR